MIHFIFSTKKISFNVTNLPFIGTSVSDSNRRRKTYGNYRKSSKKEEVKPKLDGILTWKVPGIKIDVSNHNNFPLP